MSTTKLHTAISRGELLLFITVLIIFIAVWWVGVYRIFVKDTDSKLASAQKSIAAMTIAITKLERLVQRDQPYVQDMPMAVERSAGDTATKDELLWMVADPYDLPFDFNSKRSYRFVVPHQYHSELAISSSRFIHDGIWSASVSLRIQYTSTGTNVSTSLDLPALHATMSTIYNSFGERHDVLQINVDVGGDPTENSNGDLTHMEGVVTHTTLTPDELAHVSNGPCGWRLSVTEVLVAFDGVEVRVTPPELDNWRMFADNA